MKLRLTPRAVRDVEDIADYIAAENPPAALRVRDALKGAFRLIASFPGVGAPQQRGLRRLTLPRYGYLVYYRVDVTGDAVEIIAIRHPSRDRVLDR